MPHNLKAILEQANAAIKAGDHEKFLTFCTDDTEWNIIGDQTIRGKEALRQYLAKAYIEPPQFTADNYISEGDYLAVTGSISMKNEAGQIVSGDYCDVWRFRDGKLAELRAFVVEKEKEPGFSHS